MSHYQNKGLCIGYLEFTYVSHCSTNSKKSVRDVTRNRVVPFLQDVMGIFSETSVTNSQPFRIRKGFKERIEASVITVVSPRVDSIRPQPRFRDSFPFRICCIPDPVFALLPVSFATRDRGRRS